MPGRCKGVVKVALQRLHSLARLQVCQVSHRVIPNNSNQAIVFWARCRKVDCPIVMQPTAAPHCHIACLEKLCSQVYEPYARLMNSVTTLQEPAGLVEGEEGGGGGEGGQPCLAATKPEFQGQAAGMLLQS